MIEEKKENHLFSIFPPVTAEEWEAKIITDLKGADFQKKMVWRTPEGFTAQPFYLLDDLKELSYLEGHPGDFPYTRGNNIQSNSWFIRQDISVEDPKEANKKALDILNKGIDSIGFIFSNSKFITQENLDILLQNILPEYIEVNFRVPEKEAINLLLYWSNYLQKNNFNLDIIKGSIEYDPLGEIAITGKNLTQLQTSIEIAKELIIKSKNLPQFRTLAVNGKHFTNAGARIVQSLAFTLSQGSEYLSLLTDKGLSIDDICNNIKFNLAISGDYFMEIAKLRAARFLWAKITEAFLPKNLDFCKMHIHSETTLWNKTIYDAHVNLLRTQTEAMSASLGGAESITVLPFDICYKTPDAFSERIARNQQLLLKEESHFDKIVDPSAGSYYIETLTDNIIRETWKEFLFIEENRGFIESLKENFIQTLIKDTLLSRKKSAATRKENILGINQFPNTKEAALEKIKLECPSKTDDSATDADTDIEPIKLHRASEAFEELRLSTEKSGKRPKVFMLTYGNLAMRLARSQFSGNFFGCAGYEIIDNLGFDTVEEGVKAARKVDADIVVLCSSDDEYAEIAPIALKLLGHIPLVVAGSPPSMESLQSQGINHFIHLRSNVLEVLKEFNKLMGINP